MTRKTDESPAAAPAETFVPAVSFIGYPDGETEVQFVADVESAPVPAEFVALIRKKGLAAGKASPTKTP